MTFLEYNVKKSFPAVKILFGFVLFLIGFSRIVDINAILNVPLQTQLFLIWAFIGILYIAYGLFQIIEGLGEWAPTKVE
jgi:hypothetical protein